MAVLINKDGKQLGPYSLDEARSLVLTGKLDPGDWAWPDGATEWIYLKDVPGFSGKKPEPPVSPPAPLTEEQELWRGHPSQILNLQVYLLWTVVLIIAIIGSLMLHDPQHWSWLFLGLLALVGLTQVTFAFLRLFSTEYIVSTQRVRLIQGIFSKDIQEIELFRVKDTMAHQSFFLRLCGLGTITILSGDERHPQLVLQGVPRAIELRERLRQEVMNLRQRFGVRELDVM
jgi:membrane protein YdbS with pleckstrin-like domain